MHPSLIIGWLNSASSETFRNYDKPSCDALRHMAVPNMCPRTYAIIWIQLPRFNRKVSLGFINLSSISKTADQESEIRFSSSSNARYISFKLSVVDVIYDRFKIQSDEVLSVS
jgi:hypothetical protein